jgi:hypothetical protein
MFDNGVVSHEEAVAPAQLRRETIVNGGPADAELRTAMIDQACTALSGQTSSGVTREDVVAMLTLLNRWRGFVLSVDGTAYQNVQFPPDEFSEILHVAAAMRTPREYRP